MYCQILGANGFVGRNLLAHKPFFLDVRGLYKKDVDFRKENTFNNVSLGSDLIIDCINVNDGVEKNIIECNVYGFASFIKYLSFNNYKGKYIYISTVSVLDGGSLSNSAYVHSKKIAEDLLKKSDIDSQIVRLSYPFGNECNLNRLLSKLMLRAYKNEDIYIKDSRINLNYINDVCIDLYAKLDFGNDIFISNNQYVSLFDVAVVIKDSFKSLSNIYVEDSNCVFEPVADYPYTCNYNIMDKIKEVLL